MKQRRNPLSKLLRRKKEEQIVVELHFTEMSRGSQHSNFSLLKCSADHNIYIKTVKSKNTAD